MLQIKNGKFCDIATDIFTERTEECNFRQSGDLRLPSGNTVYHGFKKLPIKAQKIWEIVP